MNGSKIDAYLACPYTHSDPTVQEWRFKRVTEAAAVLIRRGYKCIYSPITHSHPIDRVMLENQQNHTFWVEEFDMPFLANSKVLIILKLPGWEVSTGICMESHQAHIRNIPVKYLTPVYDEMFRLIDFQENPAAI